jgi:hypothetical protein
MLLIGIHKHGFGSWEPIRKDTQLGLEKKLAPSSPAAAKESAALPGPTQISARAELLFKLLREATGRKPIGGGGADGEDEAEDEEVDGKEKKKVVKKRGAGAGVSRNF